MLNRRTTRVFLAFVQAILLMIIIGSGTLFMHKHQTSSGKIVVHVHPYNLKNDPDATKHHHSENEIHFLDVVFSGTFLQVDWSHSALFLPELFETYKITYKGHIPAPVSHKYNSLRGPPAC